MAVSQALKVIAGRYRLESLIGEGGMASIWRAKDLTLARPVALKLLYARDERDHEALVARFLREARIAAAVQHRNVIHIVDFGTTEEGQPFMVMELLEGESLGDRLHRHKRLPIAETVHIASMTLRGLAAVHAAGIIHRDLKPDNIYLKEEGGVVYPKILDFGISRSVEPASGRRSALTTKEGIIVGTPEYMSPEQARGLKELDHRTDIYSMGVILYQTLSGALPFQSENVGDLIIHIVTRSPTPLPTLLPDIPPALADVIMRAMSRQPADRFQSADDMQRALNEAAEQALRDGLPRSLSDLPPPSLTIPDSEGIPTEPRQRPLMSREFALTDSTPPPAEASPAPLPFQVAEAAPAGGLSDDELASMLTGRRRRPWAAPLIGAAIVLGIAAGALWPRDEVTVSKPSAASPAAAAASPAANVAITLRHLPPGARVTIDGAAASGDRFEFPRDGRPRTIVVQADGKQRWQAVYTPSVDHAYDVVLDDDPAAAAAALAAPAPSAPDARAKAPAMRAPRQRAKKPGALRNLDF